MPIVLYRLGIPHGTSVAPRTGEIISGVVLYFISSVPNLGVVWFRLRAVNTTATDCTIQDLNSNTQYQFKVTAFNQHGRSTRATELSVSTHAQLAVPESVINMRAWATSKEDIKVTWEPPPVLNGELTNYKYVVVFHRTHPTSIQFLGVGYMTNHYTQLHIPDLAVEIKEIYI